MNACLEAIDASVDRALRDTPFLGVGLGFRDAIKEATLDHLDRIDFLELMTEHYIEMSPHKVHELEQLSASVPLVLHGVELSIGTFDSLDIDYVNKVCRVADLAKPHWISDHLCVTRVPGHAIGNLTPVPFSEVNCQRLAQHAAHARESFDRPFLLENISYYFRPPPTEMTEDTFIRRVVEDADCYLLLDLTNLLNNAINIGYDARDFLDRIPLERVVQIHLAGGYYQGSLLLDTHSHRVPDEVLELLADALPRLPNLRGVLIERDQNFPSIEDLLDELDAVRQIVCRCWGAQPDFAAVQGPNWLRQGRRGHP